jgi:hypothetical protein
MEEEGDKELMSMTMKRTSMVGAAAILMLVAAAGTSPASAGQGPKNQIKMFMLNSGVDTDARGVIIEVQNKAQSHFMIQVSHLNPNSTYDVVVNGAVMEQITTDSSGSGRVFHRVKKGGPPLPYDPAGTSVEIQLTGEVMLSAQVPSTPQEAHALVEIHFDLTAGLSVAGTAEADFRSRFGRMKFDVEIAGAVPGSYDLMIGGSNVGTITVGTSGSGRIHFDTNPDNDPNDSDGIDILLTFDPRGQSVEIQQAAVAMFTGTFPLIP